MTNFAENHRKLFWGESSRCPRCGGLLLKDGDELVCQLCGERPCKAQFVSSACFLLNISRATLYRRAAFWNVHYDKSSGRTIISWEDCLKLREKIPARERIPAVVVMSSQVLIRSDKAAEVAEVSQRQIQKRVQQGYGVLMSGRAWIDFDNLKKIYTGRINLQILRGL